MGVSVEGVAQRLRGLAEREGVALEPEACTRLAAYVVLLFRWNERMNLTALDEGGGLERLALEPLVAARHIPPEARTMIDIGSGGGSPAIPLKIVRRALSLRMVESRTRKSVFLREAVRRLSLTETVVDNCRFEALTGRAEMREAHDVLTVRGVRVDGQVAGKLQQLVVPGGRLLIFCSEGQADAVAVPPLNEERRERLLESFRSELLVLRKERAAP